MGDDNADIDDIFAEYEEIIDEEDGIRNAESVEAPADAETAEVIAPPKKRVVRNPRPKFDADRLCGERGLPILMDHFKDVKFKGPGRELEDLNRLLANLEHWTHRLFPSMRFEDCLVQIEKLGSKRPVQTCVQKIRLDMPVLSKDFIGDADENSSIVRNNDWDDPESAFDHLLNDERELESVNNNHNDPLFTYSENPPPSTTRNTYQEPLTDEQRARIERNRRLAAEKLRARKEGTLGGSNLKQGNKPSPENDELIIGAMSDKNLSQLGNVACNGAEMKEKSKKRLRVETSSSDNEDVSIDDLVEESLLDDSDTRNELRRIEQGSRSDKIEDPLAERCQSSLETVSIERNPNHNELSASNSDKSKVTICGFSNPSKSASHAEITEKSKSCLIVEKNSDEEISVDNLVAASKSYGISQKKSIKSNIENARVEASGQSAAERILAKFRKISSQNNSSVEAHVGQSHSHQEIDSSSPASPIRVLKHGGKKKRLQPYVQVSDSSDDDVPFSDLIGGDILNDSGKKQEHSIDGKSNRCDSKLAAERILAKFKAVDRGDRSGKENESDVEMSSNPTSFVSLSGNSSHPSSVSKNVMKRKTKHHSRIESSSSDEDSIGIRFEGQTYYGNRSSIDEPNKNVLNDPFPKETYLQNNRNFAINSKKPRSCLRIESSSSDEDVSFDNQ